MRRALCQVAVFSLFINLLVLTLPLYMLQVFDRVVPTRHLETLIFLTVIAAVAVVAYAVLEAVRSRCLIRIGAWTANRLKPDILAACLRSAARGVDVGKRPLEEADALKAILASPVVAALFDLPWFPLFVAVIWVIHPVLGIAAVLASAIMVTITLLADRIARRHAQHARVAAAATDRYAAAAVQNSSIVAGMAMWPDVLRTWRRRGSAGEQHCAAVDDLNASLAATTKGVRLFVQIGILGLGAYFAVLGEITIGAIIATSIMLSRALAPIDAAVAGWKQLAHAREALRHIREFLNTGARLGANTALPPPQGDIAAQSATLVLPGTNRPLLNQISFSLKAGERMAIIGASGSGKSTLCKAILGYFPLAAGHIRIDGADISDWRAEDLAPYVGYLPQRAEFLPGTIKENIARFRETVDRTVIEAAQLAGVHDMILSLPMGYDTPWIKMGHRCRVDNSKGSGLRGRCFSSRA